MIQVNNKFNIGDKVYFIDSNKKAACSVVKGIYQWTKSRPLPQRAT